ncbi:hypothetical protein RUND412_005370 [Rhizina undulata]
MAATFPAPTIPNPPSSTSSESEEPEPGPYSFRLHSGRSRGLSLNRPPAVGNLIHPPTPSPMASPASPPASFLEQQQQQQQQHKNSRRKKAKRVRTADADRDSQNSEAGLPGLSSDTESEDLEMDNYPHGGDDDDEETALTGANRRARRQERERRRNLRGGDGGPDLGDRLVMANGDTAVVDKTIKELADIKVTRDLAVNVLLIGLWYTFSLLISIKELSLNYLLFKYNKWMFAPEHLNFHFPLFTTCTHMLVQFILSSVVLFAFPELRPAGFWGSKSVHGRPPLPREDADNASGGLLGRNTDAEERKKQQQGIMTKWFYFTRVGPCGAATGLDIGLGNMSLKFITLAFYTMCKSSSLAFVLIFAFVFRLEKLTWKLVGIISVMTLGVVMMVASEAKFVLIGFVLVIFASMLSGLRWSLTQILLLRNPATSNPFSSIFFLAPVMFISILAVAIPVEGFGPLAERLVELKEKEGIFASIGIILFPGVIAFLMVSSEFALLKRTSVITLSICGIFKEVLTISAAAIVFKDPLTPVNISGLFVTILSIVAYNYIKIKKMREEARLETVGQSVRSGGEYLPVGADEDDGIDDIMVGESAVSPAGRDEFDHAAVSGIEGRLL